jgi:N-acetylglutamate synthase-like GNAT family acetyltransferase
MEKRHASQVAKLLNEQNKLTVQYTAEKVLEHADNYLLRFDDSGDVVACAELKFVQWYQFELLHVTVAPTNKRKGLASALVAEAESRARKKGAEILQSTIRKGNEESEGLFGKSGFQAVSTFLNAQSGNLIRVWQKVLVPPPSNTSDAAPESPHFLETLYKDLALALGDAIWAFARIEWQTYERLRMHSQDGLDDLLGDIGFRQRTTILRRLIERNKPDADKLERVANAIAAVEKLSERRNIIVHNPWKIWIDLDAEKFMMHIQKYTQPGKTIDLAALKQFTEECGTAETELRDSLNAL